MNSGRKTGVLLLLLLSLGLQAKVVETTQVKSVTMEGYIGKRVDDCIRKRVMGQNMDELIEPFAMHNGYWKGIRVGLFCYGDSGFAHFNDFMMNKIK